ncbi:signal peptide peptidase SppA, partial [bacterium]|nr:signal peptide peptidase SppA [bacterium]
IQHQYAVKFQTDRKRSFFVQEKDSVVEIIIEGELEDFIVKQGIFKREELGVQRKIASIRKAAEKTEVKGLLITIKSLKAGMFGQLSGIAQELRNAILFAREKGKKVVTYIEGDAGTVEYYIATAADKIVIPPTGSISGLGTYISIVRVGDFLKKLGVGLEYQTVGKYKSSFHQIADKATPEQQEMIKSIIDDLYNQLLTSIENGRDISREKAEEICNGSIYTASKGIELGLIDVCGYKNDAINEINQLTGLDISNKDIEKSSIDTIYDYHPTWGIPNKIAVIGAYGTIKTGESGEDFIFGSKTMGSDTIIEQLKKVKEDKLIKAVILRVDSGGGSGVASDLIYNAINEVKASGKKVIISMADVAGSGGYWIAAPGDTIIANPATITGSIGVMSAKITVDELFDKLKIKSETYKKGEYSDMGSLYRGYTDKEREMVKELMEQFYDLFIDRVSKSRNLPEEDVRKAAEGRVYTGQQALEIRLVDEMGGLTHAIEIAKDLANITKEPEIVVYLPKRSFLMSLIGETIINQLNLKNLISDEILQLRMSYPGY